MKKILPARRYHKTPRPLMGDAYTINGHVFESAEATDNSVYYGTFRKFPHVRNEPQYHKDDQRILFAGLQPLLDILFYEPITHQEIDESIEFLKGRKATAVGFEDWEFPEALWRRVVDECGGYIPLVITALPEGSVVYPGEPFIRVSCSKSGFGPLVPWFESTLLQCWAPSERLTAARHFYKEVYNLIRLTELPSVPNDQCALWARLVVHDFGDRAAMCPQESELVAKTHNYVFFGTDTFRGAYQNWKNGAPAGFGSSVKALAHRIVQGFEKEFDCYQQMFDTADQNEFLSMVGDCYDYWYALENKLIPLALQARNERSGKIVVARPDSGDSMAMVVGTLNRAKAAGLMTEVETCEGTKLASTSLRFIVGNGEDFRSVWDIMQRCLDEGFVPWRCGVFGIGGSLRNNLSRDDMSTKFALCAVGKDERPVVKFSHEAGKQTLPDCVVLRNEEAIEKGITLVTHEEFFAEDDTIDGMVNFYDGELSVPFGEGFTEDFLRIETRVMVDFDRMPKTGGAPSTDIKLIVRQLSEKYRHAQKKLN